MPRHTPPTAQATLYRFPVVPGTRLADYLDLSGVSAVSHNGPVEIADAVAHLVAGTRTAGAPEWAGTVTALTGVRPSLVRGTPFAVLLVRVDRWVVAAVFGSGRHLLDDLKLEHGFGLLFAIRRLDPADLRAVTSSLLDVSARSTRTNFPSGNSPIGFGLEPAGELVTRVSGMADMTGMTYQVATGGKRLRVTAGDSLSLRVGATPRHFIADLRAICAITEKTDQDSPLRFITDVRPLSDRDPVLPELEGRLARALGGEEGSGALGVCWPTAALRHLEEANSFATNNIGGAGPMLFDGFPDVDDLVARFAQMPVAMRVSELRDARLTPCADDAGEEFLTRAITLDKWIAFEALVDGRTYCLHQGGWYELGRAAVERVREQVRELLSDRSELVFPLWRPTGRTDDEHRYCELVAEQPGFLCLDKDFGRTPMHRRFEFADLVGPGDELIHVKWLARATAASHLFTQAQVAVWALRFEAEALRQLDAKVRALDSTRGIARQPQVLVLAAAGREWEVGQLFTLSMVGLLRLDAELRRHGVRLQFADIPHAPKPRAGGRAEPRMATSRS